MPCNLQPKDFSEDLVLYTTVPIHLISMEICFIFKMVKLQVYHRIIQKCISYGLLSVNAIYIPILHSYVIGAVQTVLGEVAEQEQFTCPAVQHVPSSWTSTEKRPGTKRSLDCRHLSSSLHITSRHLGISAAADWTSSKSSTLLLGCLSQKSWSLCMTH